MRDDLRQTDKYYLFHAARADLLRCLNRYREAAAAYEQAARLATNGIELNFLERRLRQVAAHQAGGTLRNTNSTG